MNTKAKWICYGSVGVVGVVCFALMQGITLFISSAHIDMLSALTLVLIGLVICGLLGWSIGKMAANYCIHKKWM